MHQMLKCLRRAFGSKKYTAYVYIYIFIHLSVHANFDDLNPYLSMTCWAQAQQKKTKQKEFQRRIFDEKNEANIIIAKGCSSK